MQLFFTKTKIIITCISAFGLTIASCLQKAEEVEVKNLSIGNSTTHTFQLPEETLRDTILALFQIEEQYDNPILRQLFFYYSGNDKTHKHLISFNAETKTDAAFGKNYFKKPNTEKDLYLHDFGFTWYSPIYFANGNPMKFRTSFILILDSINNEQTQLTIEADSPVVINGTSGLGSHGPIAREQPVQPTTVEEHILLLYIADKLGDKTVAPLKLPFKR